MNSRALSRTGALVLALIATVGLAACGGGSSGGSMPHSPGPTPTPTVPPYIAGIQHVVVIVQENRTPDNLFQEFNSVYPGAGLDVQDYGYNSHGQVVHLQPIPFEARYDIGHSHRNFLKEYNGGQMNGWDLEGATCLGATQCPRTAFGYVPKSETQPYYQLAHEFAIGDEVFQSNQGPSFPAHQYLIAGQAGGFTSPYSEEDNPRAIQHTGTGGCDIPGATIDTIDISNGSDGPFVFPCEKYAPYTTVLEEMDSAYPTAGNWAYYVPSVVSIWNAPYGVATIYDNPSDVAKVQHPETGIFDAVKAGALPKLSYVIPCRANSDHATSRSKTGPDWVASITNAIGESQYWNSSAIIVVWDDWGGWFDHEKPTMRSAYEYGFRVPMLIISPWVKRPGIVDHTRRDMTSILRFIETVFKLHRLGTLDQYTDDLMTDFDLSKGHKLLPYTPINTHGFVYTNCAGSQDLDQEPVDD